MLKLSGKKNFTKRTQRNCQADDVLLHICASKIFQNDTEFFVVNSQWSKYRLSSAERPQCRTEWPAGTYSTTVEICDTELCFHSNIYSGMVRSISCLNWLQGVETNKLKKGHLELGSIYHDTNFFMFWVESITNLKEANEGIRIHVYTMYMYKELYHLFRKTSVSAIW